MLLRPVLADSSRSLGDKSTGTVATWESFVRSANVLQTFAYDPKRAYPGFPDTFHSELRNPTVELPMPVKDIMKGVDAVIVTHTHCDFPK